MAKKPSPEKASGSKWIVDPTQRPVYYSNFAEIRLSVVDFRIRIGQMVDVHDSQLVADPLATIFMSPSHAKAFLALIQRNVARYEEKYGVIPDPQEIEV